jgi:tetratricopeptide (TPR) repeat protein
VEHASATLGLWLDRPAAATFVVTSRELLHLPGEEIFPIEPLSLKTEAIELFAERARSQDPKFALGPGNRGAVAEIVRMLDGLPLAIELAAARIRLLSPAQLVQRMRDRFHLLVGKKGAAARQATLRAAIDWSWELLPVFEQSAFAQCAVFEGGFTLEAAEAVLDLTLWPDACSATDVVQALVDKSLLRTWVPVEQRRYGVEETYFGMYISIHEYAVEKLHDSAQDAGRRAEERHGEYFATFGTDNAIDALSLHGGAQRRRALALELDNLVSACRRALSRGDVGTACAAYRATWEVVELHGPYALCAELGWQLVGLSDEMSAPLRVTASWTLAQALRRAGRLEEARPLLVQALALARDTGDLHREGSVLSSLGGVYRQLGRIADSRASFEAALAASRRTKIVASRALCFPDWLFNA